MTNQLLNEKDLARMLQVSCITLRRWRMFGTGPEWVRCGRAVRYQPEAVNQWLTDQGSRKAG